MRFIYTFIITILICCSPAFAQEAPPAQVVITKITQKEVSKNRSFIGLLYYDRVSHISTEVSGLVESITVREGDLMKKGSPIVTLNTEILDKDIALTKTRIDQIELRIQHAEKNYKRMETLYKKDGVSERDYDDALYTYQDSMKDKQVEQKEYEKLLIEKRKSVVRAPYDGIILEKNIDSGDWVQQGKQLVSIGSTQDLFIKVPIAETVLQHVTVGEQVPVIINAFDTKINGIISDIDPTADEKTKNIFLKIRIPPMDKVAENMSATVYIPTSKKRQLSIIPRDALIKFQGKDFVYTVKEEKAAILPVNIVTYLGDSVGADNPYFAEGMPIVIEGNERLQPDQPVVITGEK